MKLIFDIGNTRVKAAVSDDKGIRMVQDWQEFLPFASRVIISNVGGPHPEVYNALDGHDVLELKWTLPQVSRWLQNIPEGMGADRIAADIGALCSTDASTILIIDAGTCITYDIIHNSSIIGGSITPGIRLRLTAMHDYTALLPLLDGKGEAPIIGYDTETAMRGGVINGIRWEMEGYIRTIQKEYPDLRVFLTGGDIMDFAEDLQEIITVDPMLVIKGLDALQ